MSLARSPPGRATRRSPALCQTLPPRATYLHTRVCRWCKGTMGCKMLLTTNDKTIKLWKIYGKKIKAVTNMNLGPPALATGGGRETSFGSSSSMSSRSSSGSNPDLSDSSGLASDSSAAPPSLRLPQMSTCEKCALARSLHPSLNPLPFATSAHPPCFRLTPARPPTHPAPTIRVPFHPPPSAHPPRRRR